MLRPHCARTFNKTCNKPRKSTTDPSVSRGPSRPFTRAFPRAFLGIILFAFTTGALFLGTAPSVATAADAALQQPVSNGTEPSTRAEQHPRFETIATEAVGPGVQHETVVGTTADQVIHVLRVARDNPYVSIVPTLGRGRVEGTESVRAQAMRVHNGNSEGAGAVIGAVNADFFASSPVSGKPIGIHLERGALAISPNGRPVFGVNEKGVPVIGTVRLHGQLWRGGAHDGPIGLGGGDGGDGDELSLRAAIDEINRPLTGIELVMYTPKLGNVTPPLRGTVVTLKGIKDGLRQGELYTGAVVGNDPIESPTGTRMRIPDDGVVLAARGPAEVMLEQLTPGEWVHFQFELSGPSDRLSNAVAGWPVLLEGGEKAHLDPTDDLVRGRHPRTAVGFNEEELLLVTVDGRQPGHADGLNLHELTELMVTLGATDAINLDGGGSTTMLVRPPGQFEPVVVNEPSAGHERAVANALVLVSTAPPGALSRLIPMADPIVDRPHPPGSIMTGRRLPLNALGQDVHNEPVAVDPAWVLWDADGAAGYVEDGTGDEPPQFVATDPGRAVIKARLGFVEGALEVEVVDSIARLEIAPDVVNLTAEQSTTLDVRGYDELDRVVSVGAEQLEWSVLYADPMAELHLDDTSPGPDALATAATRDGDTSLEPELESEPEAEPQPVREPESKPEPGAPNTAQDESVEKTPVATETDDDDGQRAEATEEGKTTERAEAPTVPMMKIERIESAATEAAKADETPATPAAPRVKDSETALIPMEPAAASAPDKAMTSEASEKAAMSVDADTAETAKTSDSSEARAAAKTPRVSGVSLQTRNISDISPVVTVDGNGLITATGAGEAAVQGRLGNATAVAEITVDRAPGVLSTFDEEGVWFANTARALASITLASPPSPAPVPMLPRPIVKLQYDFTGADGATAAAYVQAFKPIPMQDRPVAIGVWVYADNNEHWLRAHVLDGADVQHFLDFTGIGGIDWTGWRFVTAPIPDDLPLPLSLERVYVAEVHRHRQGPGVLYFDGLQALYGTP